ncbi:MCE family protein [Nocardioides immobilis]|uniref:MCE family protein n=1 Tax=Nocardioides immobilis TaxID=2049295 RepID=A0A417XZC9_9ACTN|nr:MCE family protein [Nocardioides immobilis]
MITTLRRSPLAVGAVAVLLMALVAVVLLRDGGESADDGTRVVATIADAQALAEGNEVRASGVLVGQVASIELVDGKARVELEVAEGVLPIHDDATLTVRPVNLLGENFVDLDEGSADRPFLEPAVIPADQVSSAVTLQDVLNTFHEPTAASLAAVVTALGEGLDANGGEVAAAIKALAPAMENAEELGDLLGEHNQVLEDLVAATDPVATAVAQDGGRTLDRLIGSTTEILNSVAVQEEALEQTLIELPGTLTSARRTLADLSGVAGELTPTLRAIRPITDDLSDVVAELKDFAAAADPALGSLEPVLAEADALLDQAAPVVAQLRATGPDLRTTAASLRPIGRELLDENLHGVMEFVRKWALSTNGRDGISHYFRGVVYVTPTTLDSLLTSLLPANQGVDQPTTTNDGTGGGLLPEDLLGDGPLDGLLGGLDGLLGGRRDGAKADPTSALGLNPRQEEQLLDQLLGGGN